MTEQDWLAGSSPQEMLDFLWKGELLTPRKGRLFLCACCRKLWHLLVERESREAVVCAESYADGLGSPREREAHRRAVTRAYRGAGARRLSHVRSAAAELVFETVSEGYRLTRFPLSTPVPHELGDAEIAALLLEMFGNPFRPVRLDPAWLDWQDGTVSRLARRIYEQRHFDDLPILGDALEEAGCSSQAMLGHCRAAGAHVKGCWLLDLLLAGERKTLPTRDLRPS